MSTNASRSTNDYVISRSTSDDTYGLWRCDSDAPELLTPVESLRPDAVFDHRNSLVPIGGYLLEWGPIQDAQGSPFFSYRLCEFDPTNADPLAAQPVQHGDWPKKKFWGRSADFGNPHGGHEQYDQDQTLRLIPLGSYLLNFIPTDGRGTFALWNFDPCPTAPGTADPIPATHPYTPRGSFRGIQEGHELIPMNGYVLDREVDTGEYRLWSVDPQATVPLVYPPIQQGAWSSIDERHQLVPIGEYILDWIPAERSYRLWRFDPKSADPLCGPVRAGSLPDAFTPASTLLGVQPTIPVHEARASTPGTIEFMRSKIKHVVYYMLENRSFDHACGWLYENGMNGVHVIGPDGPFKGASTDYYNLHGDRKVHLSKYRDGKLSTDYSLQMFDFDPYHDNSDVLRQLFFANTNGYAERAVPDMGGFVCNNGSDQIMQTYSPEQLPVLNGLAKSFAVSDEWFCSMPTSTDVNRSFSITGSAMMELNNFMSPPQYFYWPQQPHRASIWKVLWANGFTDWKIYNSTEWYEHVFTYQLYLEGQIPTVDENVAAKKTDYIADIEQFYKDAQDGNLPAFSYLEPVWISKTGTTSYHPGEDIVPCEVQLNEVYNALREGPGWEQTLLVITFDEHGGIYDHVPPPYAENPWPNDESDGFRYDIMGPRVPTILVSPWIEAQTLFRSETDVAYDATSFLATLLHWAGIPKSRWFLGERTNHAPTFEGVLARSEPRADSPSFTPPYDLNFPPDSEPKPTTTVHDLHLHVAHQVVTSMARGKLSPAEISTLSHEVAQETDLGALTDRLNKLQKRLG